MARAAGKMRRVRRYLGHARPSLVRRIHQRRFPTPWRGTERHPAAVRLGSPAPVHSFHHYTLPPSSPSMETLATEPPPTTVSSPTAPPGPARDGGPNGAGPLTIPPDWNPPQPECDPKYHVWGWGTGWRRLVLGGPTQTTACLPPGWTTDATFEATQCPSGYTAVPTACDWAPDAVVCCTT